ncbi:hypothetical protein ElyMa_001348900 [Elysia marginata]|uniref:Reverse transcriptase domain-containing protein n=1 Tax=Elysia marginata TaxID=1093978 RepID=A0AAV4IQH5_9GAST|nr:hypothetical protein ElyMa_001348900 [Elysia marginata]
MGKEKLLERWAEYIGELFDDDRKDHDVMKRNFAGLPILEDEVRSAIRKMKTGKATGPDGVSIELTEALEDYGTEQGELRISDVSTRRSKQSTQCFQFIIDLANRDHTELTDE